MKIKSAITTAAALAMHATFASADVSYLPAPPV